ncbi:hypothetical protein ACMFMG_011228 [Clarireedia jacksonii]
MTTQLRTLNLGHFTSGTQEQRLQFVDELLAGFIETGFVKLVNHGFDEQKLNDLFSWSKEFFNQPLEAKNEIPNEKGPRPMRGYSAYEVEMASNVHPDEKMRGLLKDAKEHFDQGAANDKEFPNKWLDRPELAGFRPFMESFYEQCDDVCLTLVKALEVGFGLDSGALIERCIPSATDLRLTHYPEISMKEMKSGRTNRIAPHSDYGIVTLLFQDSTGGLEIEDKTKPGAFLAIPPTDTNEMIVNVGDTLQRWTNGKLFGCVHRVTIPESMKHEEGGALPERFSMAYLFKAQRDVSVGPLSKFVTYDNPAKYPDMNALEYQSLRNNLLYT